MYETGKDFFYERITWRVRDGGGETETWRGGAGKTILRKMCIDSCFIPSLPDSWFYVTSPPAEAELLFRVVSCIHFFGRLVTEPTEVTSPITQLVPSSTCNYLEPKKTQTDKVVPYKESDKRTLPIQENVPRR